MFRRRRGHGHGLFGLILAFLGFKWVFSRCCDDADRDEMKAKAKEFRSKMKDAFEVWREEPKAQPESGAGTSEEA